MTCEVASDVRGGDLNDVTFVRSVDQQVSEWVSVIIGMFAYTLPGQAMCL